MDDRHGFLLGKRVCFASPKRSKHSRCLGTTFLKEFTERTERWCKFREQVGLMQCKCAFFQASYIYCIQIAVKMVKQPSSNGSELRKERPHIVWVPGAITKPPLFIFQSWFFNVEKTTKNATSKSGIILFGLALFGVKWSHPSSFDAGPFTHRLLSILHCKMRLPLPHSLEGKDPSQ